VSDVLAPSVIDALLRRVKHGQAEKAAAAAVA
jgi:hypothetical protein